MPPVIVKPLSREGTASSKSKAKHSKLSSILIPGKAKIKDKVLSMTNKRINSIDFKIRKLGSNSSQKSLSSVGSKKSGKDDLDKKSVDSIKKGGSEFNRKISAMSPAPNNVDERARTFQRPGAGMSMLSGMGKKLGKLFA